jgi:hypothetical protein
MKARREEGETLPARLSIFNSLKTKSPAFRRLRGGILKGGIGRRTEKIPSMNLICGEELLASRAFRSCMSSSSIGGQSCLLMPPSPAENSDKIVLEFRKEITKATKTSCKDFFCPRLGLLSFCFVCRRKALFVSIHRTRVFDIRHSAFGLLKVGSSIPRWSQTKSRRARTRRGKSSLSLGSPRSLSRCGFCFSRLLLARFAVSVSRERTFIEPGSVAAVFRVLY